MPEISNRITIAIDGFSSCGKSTLAKDLARRLGYLHIDSGAMYRAVTLYFIQHDIGLDDPQAIKEALPHIEIAFIKQNGNARTLLNGVDVEKEIRSMKVSVLVSPVSTISEVRRALVKQQRILGKDKGVIMEGRDIGTVVFPDAELKLFMTASTEIRIQRRTQDLAKQNIEATPEQIEQSIIERDHIDSTRIDSPLTQASDAIVLDNTFLSRDEQLDLIYQFALNQIKA